MTAYHVGRVRFELEAPQPALPNILPNPNGQFGVTWGWNLGANTTLQPGTIITGTEDNSFRLRQVTPNAAAPGFIATDYFPVTPGQFLGAQFTVTLVEAGVTYFGRIEVTDAAGTVILNGQTSARTTTGTVYTNIYTAPPASTQARLVIFTYTTTANRGIDFSKAMLARSNTTIAASFPYVDPVVWTDITGPSYSCRINRDELDVSVCTLGLRDVAYSPAVNAQVRRGKRVRVTAFNGTAWYQIFNGRIDNAKTTYLGQGKVDIELTALDVVAELANIKEARGVATLGELAHLLKGRVRGWNINGAGSLPAVLNVVSNNPDAYLLDQIGVTRDTNLAYAWVDRKGIVNVFDQANLPSTTAAAFSDAAGATYSYSGIDASFNTDDVINSVKVKYLRYNSGTQTTEEVEYPRDGSSYQDAASVAEYGPREATFVVNAGSANENTTWIANYASQILAANATPQNRINSLTMPVKSLNSLSRTWSIDLYSKVEVTLAGVATAQPLRVRTIEHNITAEKWLVTYGFGDTGSVATPTPTPPPPAVVSDYSRIISPKYVTNSGNLAAGAESADIVIAHGLPSIVTANPVVVGHLEDGAWAHEVGWRAVVGATNVTIRFRNNGPNPALAWLHFRIIY